MPLYTVQQGDCLESLAKTFGLQWESIWTHPENSDLRQQRQDPNVLLPGDQLFIPDLTPRYEDCVTDRRHQFVLKGRSSKLVLVLKDFDRPRANQAYILTVDGQTVSGKTDNQGRIEERIRPDASAGRLLVGPAEAPEEYVLALGHIDPVEEVSGLEGRLYNLGFHSLSEFQKRYRLQVTGAPDDATRNKLREEYGC